MIHLLGRLPIEDFFVCVSGGVDSMTLLHFLLKGKRKFTALYFDHGTDHGREARFFVQEQCEKLGVSLEIGHLWPKDYDPRKSQEENWRDCRYDFISRYSDKGTILQAHHLNDAVEPYIMTALRGKPRIIPYRNEQYNIIRPNDMLVCLVTMAATMSVPPLLPLCEKVMPSPMPHSAEPMMMFMNGCCCTSG